MSAFMKASDIDTSKLNPAMKGLKCRAKPLFDIYDGGKQKGFALNVRFAGDKRYSNQYAPFLFETQQDAESAAELINEWAKS